MELTDPARARNDETAAAPTLLPATGWMLPSWLRWSAETKQPFCP